MSLDQFDNSLTLPPRAKSSIGRRYSYIRDTYDIRDTLFADIISPAATPPPKSDLTQYILSIEDQGSEGSCTGHGWTSSKELRQNMLHGDKTQLSRQFVYELELRFEGNAGHDVGAQIRTGAQVLTKVGVCAESLFPYHPGGFASKISQAQVADAAKRLGGTYSRITSLAQVKQSLANGWPVVFGASIYQSFESDACLRTGHIPMPNTSRESLLGGHCMYFAGHDDSTSTLITPNSWGTSVGDHGIFYMPYAFFNQYVIDAWNIQI